MSCNNSCKSNLVNNSTNNKFLFHVEAEIKDVTVVCNIDKYNIKMITRSRMLIAFVFVRTLKLLG